MSDLIERQKAIDALDSFILDETTNLQGDSVREILESLPSAQPERQNGRWEMKPDPFVFFGEIPVCSECGYTTKMRDKTKFCPHCGAQMEGQ